MEEREVVLLVDVDCNHYQVDADALLKFTLVTVRQLVMVHGDEEKLRAHLRSRATANVAEKARKQLDQRIDVLTRESDSVQRQLELAKRRMTDETDEEVYDAHRSAFLEKSGELKNLQTELAACHQRRDNSATDGVESQVQMAMKLLA